MTAPPRHADRNERAPYHPRNATPPQRNSGISHGRASTAAPIPATPAAINTASDKAQVATTAKTCSRRSPCRSTNPAQLSALSAVIRLGAFDAAAHTLGVTPSAISQRIKALEDRIGTTLIQRGTPCTATPTGARLARHFDDLTILETALAADIGQTTAPARLRVAVNADSLATWFLPAIADHPMLFDLLIDDQDHSADWLRKGEVSAAITGEAGPVQGCDSFPLGA
ncbi:MAG: ArgP/LysG family DNA-binding transcriptional regulator, partial [Marivivens sp.]|nr:ArgP/LysG family DNA-binding transcriptional regulator [Marivivens sp.]